MKCKTILTIATATVALAALGGAAASAQDKYNLKVPGGLAFSEFRGYEHWEAVSTHVTDDPALLKLIVANPVAIDAYRAGVPGNGKPFPNGSKFAKIEWKPKKGTATDAPYDERLPGTIYHVELMVKDDKRFADSGGWGYAMFLYDVASDKFTPATLSAQPPQGNDAKCGAACHTLAKAKGYVFTEYANR